MSYTKQTWADGDVITAAKLNHIEDGVGQLSEDKADKTAIPSIPTKLPNPNALTFTGAVTGTYDGSAAVTVDIPVEPVKLSISTADGGLDITV